MRLFFVEQFGRSWLMGLSLVVSIQLAMFGQTAVTADRARTRPATDPNSMTLGPGDTVALNAIDEPELSKSWVISHSGDLYLPYLGRVPAAGKTVAELERNLIERLKQFIKNPMVTVNVTELRSRPVTVSGAVRNPGIYQIEGGLTLLQVLALAGGVEPGTSGITLTRRKESGSLDLPHVKWVNGGAETAVELSLKDILRADGPAAELELRPHDVVRVERSQDRLVYVAGEVNTPGAIQLRTHSSIHITQALAMAGGYKSTAILDKAIVWSCCDADQKVRMSLVDLKKILTGQAEDRQLKEGDYLLIRPKSQKNILPMIASFAALASAMGTLALVNVH